MMHSKTIKSLTQTALIAISAVCIVSCGRGRTVSEPLDPQTLITSQSTDLTIRNSENGKLSYVFEAPLMEEYASATEPYAEYRRGIRVVRYDTAQVQEMVLTADYAKRITPKRLWEARGNVVVIDADGKVLTTEQLFYDEAKDWIYSYVSSRLVDGEKVTVADTFETNSSFKEYHFRGITGRTLIDTERTTSAPDTAAAAPAPVLPPADTTTNR